MSPARSHCSIVLSEPRATSTKRPRTTTESSRCNAASSSCTSGCLAWRSFLSLCSNSWAAAYSFLWLPLALALAAGALLIMYTFLDQATANMHLFYRERLATAFVGLRTIRDGKLVYCEPPWREPIWFSGIQGGKSAGKLPNLVVCASANVSEDVPPGRLAASFTFEKNYSGGPLTGYVPTKQLEGRLEGAC